MKNLIAALILGLLNTNGQAQEAFRRLLLIEPSQANGFFILDQKKMGQEGVSTVEVVAMVDKLLPDGQMERSELTTFTIENGHFGRLDPALRSGLTADETLHYRLIGRNNAGEEVVDVAETPPGGWMWPAVCKVSCNSASYAWSLTGYSNGAQTVIDLQNGSDDGVPFYFYVPVALWGPFTTVNYWGDFGFSQDWNALRDQADFPNQYQPDWEVIKVLALTGQERMLNGYPVGALYTGQVGYGFRKDRGPWRGLDAYTNNYAQPSLICMNLRPIYNADPLVQSSLATYDLPDLACVPIPGPHTGSVSWGSSGPSDCFSSIHLADHGGNVAGWADALLDCFSSSTSTGNPGTGNGTGVGGLLDANEIVVSAWQPGSSNEVLRVAPNSKDPRLVSVEKTVIEPGLYEFRIHLKDGTILRHFEEVTTSMILRADFTSFVNITIYPVPVKERMFAVDFDLENPTSINMTVVNNVGVNYYNKALQFDLAGLNKHLVRMSEQWPSGLYHAQFQFGNGSTQSRSFTVDAE